MESGKSRPFYLKIMDEIERKKEILLERYKNKENIKKNSREEVINNRKIQLIEQVSQVFYYVLFWDSVRNIDNLKSVKDLKETVKKIALMRKEIFEIDKDEDFEKALYKQIKDDMIKKDIFLDNFESNEFMIDLSQHRDYKNLYYAKLEHNVQISMVYSDQAINRVYNEGIVLENKLRIEYILLSVIIMRDAIRGSFDDDYIVEFSDSFFKKKQKFDSEVAVINNQLLQDKIYINIPYSGFIKNKEMIMEYISRGYNFAITLDNGLKSVDDLDRLKIFKYVILDKNLNIYKDIVNSKKKYINIINA